MANLKRIQIYIYNMYNYLQKISKIIFQKSSKNQQPNFQIYDKKERLQKLHKHLYTSCDYQSEPYIEEMSLFGQNSYVVSSSPSSLFSMQQGLAFLDYVNVECVILDKYSLRSLNKLISLNTPLMQVLDDKALMGKSKFTRFFVDEMPLSSEYFMAEQKKYIYRVSEKNEKAYFEDQLSVAYEACNDIKKNIILSKPDSQLFFEDLVMQVSLEQMKDIFHQGVKAIREKLKEKTQISDDNKDLLTLMQEYVKGYHQKEIFTKWSLYNASLVHKCARTFKNSTNFTDRHFTRQTVEFCHESVLPEYNQVFRSFLHSKQQEIKYRNVLNPDAEQDKYQATLHKSKSTILEQYALASFLVNFDLRSQATQGDDIFFGSIFKQKITESDIPEYLSLHKEYSNIFHNLQNDIIQSIGHNLYEVEFALVPDKKQVEAIQSKKYNYEYQIHDLSNAKQQLALAVAFHTQMNNIINKRNKAGISQTESIAALKQINQNHYTEQSLRSYIQLLMDANIGLGYPLKFPRKLMQSLMPYVSNVERDRLATQYTTPTPLIHEELEFIAANAIKGKPLPKASTKKALFSDDESEDVVHRKKLIKEFGQDKNSVQFQNFILGHKGQTGEFPYDISQLSYEEMMDLGFETIGSQEFKISEDGLMESSHPLDPDVMKEINSYLDNKDPKNEKISDDDDV